MKTLAEILEGIEDHRQTLVRLSNGDCFGLVDFEMVDESIYQRSDLCVGDIVSKVEVQRDVYEIGNKLEFSVEDVLEIEDVESGDVLYRKQVDTGSTP